MNKKMLYSLEKKILAFVLAFAMVATGLYILSPQAQEAKASEAVSTSSKTVKADTANQEMLSIKMQANEVDDKGTSDVTDDTVDLRIVSSVNGLGYSEVGFKVWFGSDIVVDENGQMEKEPTAKFHTTQVLERIKAGVEYNFSPKVIDTTSEYFVTGTLKGILQTNWNTDFYISAYCVSLDGSVTTEGVGRYFNVAEATSQSVINIPVAVDEESASDVVPVGGTVNVTVAEKLTTAVVESYIDGYAHLNISVPSAAMVKEAASVNKELLPSASVVSIVALSDEPDITYVELGYDTIYRNLESKYENKGAGDASWYSAYVELYQNTDKEPTAFTIATDADLYGLQLAVSQAEDVSIFLDKTFYLIADITVNEGTATSNWSSHAWTPISGFNTVFDGQGHTISGLYVAAADGVKGVGFFTETAATTVIQDLKLLNSCLVATDSNGTGTLIGRGCGTIKGIYTDAELSNTSGNYQNIGGVIGFVSGETVIETCWSDSDITSKYINVGGIVGNANAKETSIKHCLYTGTLAISSGCTASNAYAGGIVGKSGAGSGTSSNPWKGSTIIEDCFSEGIVKSDSTTTTNSIGGIVGYGTGEDADGNATLTITNSYCADRNDGSISGTIASAVVGAKPNIVSLTRSDIVSLDNLKDSNAFYHMALDFQDTGYQEGYWVARKENTPILAKFLDETDTVTDVSVLSDDSFELTNNIGYIANAEQLADFRDQINSDLEVNEETLVRLTGDIAINTGTASDDYTTWTQWTPIVGFVGTFDGRGHSVSGLYVDSLSDIKGQGMFTLTTSQTVIQRLAIANSYMANSDGVAFGTAVLVGQGCGTFTDIYVAGTINAFSQGKAGGIIGTANGDVTIQNCWNASQITATSTYCGGMLGTITGTGFNITIEHCLNTGDLRFEATGNSYFGGMVGRANTSSGTEGLLQIIDCLNLGAVITNNTNGARTGGLLGFGSTQATGEDGEAVATSIITNSYCAINCDENGEQIGVSTVVGHNTSLVDMTGSSAVDYDNLLGTDALTNAPNLDYVTSTNADGHWVAREGATPMLVSFLSDTDIVVIEE